MKKFHFEVSDGFFPQKFSTVIEAATQQEAEQLCRECYAEDLGTMEDKLIVEFKGMK
jgi:hypothetical protein